MARRKKGIFPHSALLVVCQDVSIKAKENLQSLNSAVTRIKRKKQSQQPHSFPVKELDVSLVLCLLHPTLTHPKCLIKHCHALKSTGNYVVQEQ